MKRNKFFLDLRPVSFQIYTHFCCICTIENSSQSISSLHQRSTFFRDVNNDIMELLIVSYACKTSCAHNIIGVIPYLPYSKQSKMRKRGSVVCKVMATMLGKSGKCVLQYCIKHYTWEKVHLKFDLLHRLVVYLCSFRFVVSIFTLCVGQG